MVLFVQGCAPGLGKRLQVKGVLSPEAKIDFQDASHCAGKAVRVGSFEDRRSYSEVGEIDGRLLQPEGNAALGAQWFMEKLLRTARVQTGLVTGPWLVGQILDWRVRVIPGFPTTKAEAEASVRIELRDEGYGVLYAATYAGRGQAEHPFMTQTKVEEVLADAMWVALSGVIDDQELWSRIR